MILRHCLRAEGHMAEELKVANFDGWINRIDITRVFKYCIMYSWV